MNVLFHTTAAFGVAVMLTDTKRIKPNILFNDRLVTGFFAFILGILSHGVLDYMPHCYPINAKVDAIFSLLIIIIVTYLTKNNYRHIVAFAFIGGIFPDVIDLSPQILNKYLCLTIPISNKFFPWHWKEYSGSIYINNCNASLVNHVLLILTILIICWARRNDVRQMFNRKE